MSAFDSVRTREGTVVTHREADAMWMDEWLLDTMFLEQIAEVRREAETRGLSRVAETQHARRVDALGHRLHVLMPAWAHRLRDRYGLQARRTAWRTERTHPGVPS